MALTDEDLRDAANHRGLKLVKSRRRKPGVGDFGLFGLTDATGKPLFGVGEDGLTASAEQIADFLRKGEASTWAASAKVTPARSEQSAATRRPTSADDEDAPSAIRPRRHRSASASVRPVARKQERAVKAGLDEGRQADEEAVPETRPARGSERGREPEAKPELAIRSARPSDAAAVRRMLTSRGLDASADGVKRTIAAATTRKEPILVADRGGVIGCLAWHIIPTIEQKFIARITAIVVDEDERRRGVGRALFEAAMSEFRRRKVRSIEAMSPIEVRNANGFYRALGLKQASYSFAADV
jgi:N-acetylglutamate synthase-like GNAT family acetyltransferase